MTVWNPRGVNKAAVLKRNKEWKTGLNIRKKRDNWKGNWTSSCPIAFPNSIKINKIKKWTTGALDLRKNN